MNKEDKFLSVIESHKGILYKVANNYCKNREDRKDLIQEIIYQLWKGFDNYNPQFQYSTWIYRISLNVAISFYRKQRTITQNKVDIDDSLLVVSDILFNPEMEDNLNLLQQFIYELKEMDKAIMLLYLEQKSHKEIAEIIGISESNVGTKVSRIKMLLTQKFKK
jgi:RNA polymerase sigma-70 factor (ECF subfamily)